MTPRKSPAVKKTALHDSGKHTERVPNKFDLILEELQAMRDYGDERMDFSRYNTLEEHMQLLDESNCWTRHSKNNHKLVANL